MSIPNNMVTTSFDLPDCKIIESLGIVRGISVRCLSFSGSFVAGIQTWFGGNIPRYTELCEKTRKEAYDLLILHAQEMGANAIIGMHYDANEIGAGITEVLAYGTGVIIEKNK